MGSPETTKLTGVSDANRLISAKVGDFGFISLWLSRVFVMRARFPKTTLQSLVIDGSRWLREQFDRQVSED